MPTIAKGIVITEIIARPPRDDSRSGGRDQR